MEAFRIYVNRIKIELCKALKDHRCERCKQKIKIRSFYIFREAEDGYLRERYHINCGLRFIDSTIRKVQQDIRDLKQYKKEIINHKETE